VRSNPQLQQEAVVAGDWEREWDFAREHTAPRKLPAAESKTQKKEIA
jgi:hypothetical protein